MKLSQLLTAAGLESKILDCEITALCCDSRQAVPGCLFFALVGSQEDGSQYIEAATKAGAVAIIIEDNSIALSSITLIKVKDARLCMAKMAAAFFIYPSRKLALYGVTGTNGKTTTTYLIEHLLGPATTGLIGTINVRYPGFCQTATHTTPESIQGQNLLAEMVKAGCKNVAMEVSSHALDQKRVHGMDFDACIFTNLTQDHLDYHKTLNDYFLAKQELFTTVLAQSMKPNKLAILNLDDPYTKKLLNALGQQKIRTFSLSDTSADVYPLSVTYRLTGTSAKLSWLGEEKTLESSLLGPHNLANLMGALLIGQHAGLSFEDMAKKTEKLSVPGRLQRILSKTKPGFFVDYAHTPDALINVLKTLRAVMPQEGPARLVVVFGCGGDRDRSKRPLMGEACAQLADLVILTSDNPRTEDAQKILDDILPGVQKYQKPFDGKNGYQIEPDRKKALRLATSTLRPEDVILVAGKGHEDYQIISKEKQPFDDAKILGELLSC